MKLVDIKKQLIDAYFSSQGTGLSEEVVERYAQELLELLKIEPSLDELNDELQEIEDPTSAYRKLMKEDIAIGYVSDEAEALYVVARRGKKFASVNLTSPSKTVRQCSLREIREAFLEAAERQALFKVSAIRQ